MYTFFKVFFQYSLSKNAIFWKYSNFHFRKTKFWSIWGHFFNVKFFPRRGWLFSASTIETKCSIEKISSPAGLNKKSFSFLQKYRFGLPRYTFKVDFLNEQKNFEKSLVSFLWKFVRNLVSNLELSILEKVRGDSCFVNRHFWKSLTLASCNFVGRPLVVFYVYSTISSS